MSKRAEMLANEQASTRRRPSFRGVLVALGSASIAALGIACPKPTDPTPQIAVTPGAARRIGYLRSRAAGEAAPSGAGRARVHPMKAGEQLGGPNVTGKVGDWVIENDEVVFVVDALGGGGGFAESGGNLVDAADARVRKDELGQVFTYFGTFPRQALYGSIDARVEPDGTAVLVAKGKELLDSEIDVTTEYRLAPGDRALLLRTTLRNGGASAKPGLGLGDAIQWGGTEKVAPGKKLGFKGPSSGPYLGGIGRFVSYAITSTDGQISATSGAAWSDTVQVDNVTIPPGKAVTYERVFVVGQRPDAASIVSELVKASGEAVGALEIALVDASGTRVKVDPGAKVVLGTSAGDDVLSVVASAEGDVISGEVPPGKWTVTYAPSAGRRGDGRKVAVEVKKGEVARAALSVTEPSTAKLGPCEEQGRPIPCKLTVEGIAPSSSPDFGPAHVAGPAKNQITLLPGEAVTVPLAHGSYRVTASRGPEYELATRDITLPRDAATGAFALRRVVDTRGYVSVDSHQHTMLSADAPVSMRDRVIANAAEGLEIGIATEHNVVADLRPTIRELGLSGFVVSIPGDELTTDSSKKPWGHANVFPLEPHPDRPRGGAVAVRDRPPSDVFAEVRAEPGGPRALVVNHPRSGRNGYFELLGFDPSTGLGRDPAYDASFDAIEVWNGPNVEQRSRVFADFVALLRTARPTTPIASTDTHGIVGQEAGYPRTYVRLADDAQLDPWDVARTSELVKSVRERRDVVLTNGPFVTASVRGVGSGGIARAPRGGGAVSVEVRVVSASWNAVDRMEIHRIDRKGDVVRTGIVLAPKKDTSGSGAYVATAVEKLTVTDDCAVVVVVSGETPMRPVLLTGEDAELRPWAMTGPIWLDVDGDEKSLGR